MFGRNMQYPICAAILIRLPPPNHPLPKLLTSSNDTTGDQTLHPPPNDRRKAKRLQNDTRERCHNAKQRHQHPAVNDILPSPTSGFTVVTLIFHNAFRSIPFDSGMDDPSVIFFVILNESFDGFAVLLLLLQSKPE